MKLRLYQLIFLYISDIILPVFNKLKLNDYLVNYVLECEYVLNITNIKHII